MYKVIIYLLIGCFMLPSAQAQELFVFSEPASNMPSNSLSAKLDYRTPVSKENNSYKQRYSPEVMFGIDKHWMLHVSTGFSDFYTAQVRWESVKTYVKYRFYSDDDIHKHFRMSAFAQTSYSRSPFYYGDINLDGDNSGVQAGIIATQLINKLAVSGTASVIRAFTSQPEHIAQMGNSLNALYYSLSAGYLLFPLNYTSYKQTNLNIYFETIGMKGFDKGDYMLDLAPALQLIFNSNFKVNLGARLQVTGNMQRISENNYYISFERTFLGALRKKKKVG